MPEETPEQQTQTPETPAVPETPPATPAPAPKTFDESYVRALRDESAGYRVKAKTLEEELSTARVAVEKLPTVEVERDTLKAQVDRLQVAIEKGLPLSLVDRLRGDDREALAADADSLLSLLGNRGATFDQGPKGDVPPPDLRTQIATATATGDWRTAMALKAQLAMQQMTESRNP